MSKIRSQEFPTLPIHIYQNRKAFGRSPIYLSVLVFSFGVLCVLPIIEFDVYKTTRGMIKPLTERQTLTMINSGKIIFARLTDNLFVQKGDTLLIIENDGIDQQLTLVQTKLTESEELFSDVSQLSYKMDSIGLTTFRTRKYYNEFKHFIMESEDHDLTLIHLKNEFNRNQKLYEKGVISRVELEVSNLKLSAKRSQIQLFKDTWKAKWDTEARELRNTCFELQLQKKELNNRWSTFVMIAPITGNLINAMHTEVGNFINAGTLIAEISPEKDLIVECYIDPVTVGFIKKSLDVNFKVDAYDYNYWGVISGKILEIFNDVEYRNNSPVYKVRCSLNQNFLQLKNGQKGWLKKGMTLTAQFRLTRRTLWNLLYDQADDWLNPNENQLFR